jgi:hypothetical protein
MAQTNFTPILLYASSTAAAVPNAANLTNSAVGSELAINIADKNLFFKDSTGTVNTVPIRQSSTSSNGWLSSTDWNTFNNKAPATSGTSLLYGNGSGGFSNVTIGSGITFAGGTLSATGTGGTVTSVTGTSPIVSSGGTTPAISLATAYGDTLNPYASKIANYILAAPNGSAGVPTFRALVAADLPSLSSVYIPYTGASSAIDLNAQTITNIAHLGINTTSVPDILLRAFGDNNSASRIAIRGYSSNASSSSMRVAKFRGTYAAPQAPLSGDSLGKFELAGYGTTSANGYPQASYEGVATENWGATARGAKALFYVTPNTTTTQTLALTLNQDSTAVFANTVTANGVLLTGNLGTVTSVTGTSPVVSSGGTTPAISMPAATTSVSGYLTSTDWNTFNNKGSGTVTSVTGTAPVVSSGGATPAISMAAATSSVNGYLTSIDWTTFNNKGSGTVTSVAALTLGTSGTDLSSTIANGTTTPIITLNVPTASATNRGALSAADWTTFNNKGNGTVTSVTGTAPVVSSGGTTPAISMAAATTSVNGYLTSTDWTTFNGKQAALVSGTNIKTVGGVSLLGSGDVGTIGVNYGGTGLTTLTAGYIPYGNGTSAFSSSSNFYFSGTQLGVGTSSPTITLSVGISSGTGGINHIYTGGGGPYSVANFTSNLNTGEVQIGGVRTNYFLTFYSSGGEAGRFDTSGRLMVGTTSQFGGSAYVASAANGSGSQCFAANNTDTGSASQYVMAIYRNLTLTGGIQNTNLVTTYTSVSDRRLKSNIASLTTSGEFIDSLLPRTYTWDLDGSQATGFIADELQITSPTSVSGKKDEIDLNGKPVYQSIDTSTAEIIANIVAELQSLRTRLKAANIT